MANYYESEVLPMTGTETNVKKAKVKKTKMKCTCGHIDYRLTCPKCGGAMFKYVNQL
jgi:hypothetical protein